MIQKLNHFKSDPYTVYLEGLAPSGRRSMKSLLKGVLKEMDFHGRPESFPWEKMRYVHLVRIRTLLKKQGKSSNTINTAISAIKGVIRSGFNMGLISADNYLRSKSVKHINIHQSLVGRSLKKSEIKKMIAVCKRDKCAMGVRDAAVIALMVSTGLRRSEVVSINCEDFNDKQDSLIIHHGKGDKKRLAILTAPTQKILKQWVQLRAVKVGALFTRTINNQPTNKRISAQTIYNIIDNRSKQAGLEKCSPHDLRRTLVTHLLDLGTDLNTVRQIIGHENINTTVRYDRRDELIRNKIIINLSII